MIIHDADNASVLVSDSTSDDDNSANVSVSVIAPNTSMHIHNSPPNVILEKDLYDFGMHFMTNILVQGMASMRLKSNDMEGANTAILIWFTYCEEYLKAGFEKVGFNSSQLFHAYDWVQIDDFTLDVYFVGKIIEDSGRNIPTVSVLTKLCKTILR